MEPARDADEIDQDSDCSSHPGAPDASDHTDELESSDDELVDLDDAEGYDEALGDSWIDLDSRLGAGAVASAARPCERPAVTIQRLDRLDSRRAHHPDRRTFRRAAHRRVDARLRRARRRSGRRSPSTSRPRRGSCSRPRRSSSPAWQARAWWLLDLASSRHDSPGAVRDRRGEVPEASPRARADVASARSAADPAARSTGEDRARRVLSGRDARARRRAPSRHAARRWSSHVGHAARRRRVAAADGERSPACRCSSRTAATTRCCRSRSPRCCATCCAPRARRSTGTRSSAATRSRRWCSRRRAVPGQALLTSELLADQRADRRVARAAGVEPFAPPYWCRVDAHLRALRRVVVRPEEAHLVVGRLAELHLAAPSCCPSCT